MREKVEKQINFELNHGHYCLTENKPNIVSAIAAVPKANGEIRLIHDLSRPEGQALNNYASKDLFQYSSVEDAVRSIDRGWYMAKVDLKSAYRTVPIHPSQHNLTGLKWTFTGEDCASYLFDTRLPFGARKSPYVFHRLTQAVKRMMQRKGFDAVTVYLDDFFIAAPSFSQCLEAYNSLISLLRKLGFWINWSKVCDPSTRMTFLGVVIDSVNGTLSLEDAKVQDLCGCLQEFQQRVRASRRQLESLAGRLSWAANVIPWGRTHLRPIFDLICTLNEPSHKARLTAVRDSFVWWEKWLKIGNNTKLIWDNRPELYAFTDSCTAGGIKRR